MKSNLGKIFIYGILCSIPSSIFSFNDEDENSKAQLKFEYSTDYLSTIKDTVYTLKPSFLEVNIASQMGYLHFKDSIFTFKVSTGTKRLEDGIETNEGLFVIQSKKPKWYSIQFDSTLMLNWMGFNYGVGFHALAGKSYYRFLGKKKSSHGCVRVSKEDAVIIYKHIELGTPVLVHSGNNVVTVAFGDSVQYMKIYSYSNLKKILPERFNKLYNGNYFWSEDFSKPKIFIDDENVNHDGLPIGNSKLIAKRQTLKPLSLFIGSVIPTIKNCMIIDNYKFPEFSFRR